jgi:hypothetical protein
MAIATGVRDSLAQTDHSPVTLARKIGAQILRPRYSLLEAAIAVVLLGVIITTIASSWMARYRRQLDAAVFESPLPDVQLAEARPVPTPVVYTKSYEFTTDWFTWDIPVWERALEPYRGRPDVQYLEIGVYEGRSALWTLENILTHPTSRLTCIDLFDGPYKARFAANLQRSGASGKVTAISDYSQLALRKLPLNNYDIIYIDGSHSKEDVLEDAVLSWRLLKEGGTMIFDDYRWVGCFASGTSDAPTDFCKTAIDRFVQCFDRHFEVIHNSGQLILRKVSPKRR